MRVRFKRVLALRKGYATLCGADDVMTKVIAKGDDSRKEMVMVV